MSCVLRWQKGLLTGSVVESCDCMVAVGNCSMGEDGQQQASGQPNTATATSDVRQSDLQAQEGVGRCYYTQLPRLVKVSSASTCKQYLQLAVLLIEDI